MTTSPPFRWGCPAMPACIPSLHVLLTFLCPMPACSACLTCLPARRRGLPFLPACDGGGGGRRTACSLACLACPCQTDLLTYHQFGARRLHACNSLFALQVPPVFPHILCHFCRSFVSPRHDIVLLTPLCSQLPSLNLAEAEEGEGEGGEGEEGEERGGGRGRGEGGGMGVFYISYIYNIYRL